MGSSLTSTNALAVGNRYLEEAPPVDTSFLDVSLATNNTHKNLKGISLEAYVREYFAATPALIDVARCESRFRQYDETGAPLRGKEVEQDIGIMQINEKYHLSQSQKLNLDIYHVDGNLAYAKWLYDKQGLQPWMPSAPCWNAAHPIAVK